MKVENIETKTICHTPNGSLPHEWKRWIAENKMMNVQDDKIFAVLLGQGIDKRLIQDELSVIANHPYFQAGDWMAQRLRKLECLQEVQRGLSRLTEGFGRVDKRHHLSRDEFLQNYYALNRPVVLTDSISNWRALSCWNLNYLKNNLGNELVEIMDNRNSDPLYEINLAQHKKTISFGEYIDMVANGGETNDYYMVANNHFLERPSVKALLEDIEMLPEYLEPKLWAGRVFFWFGPAGTVTPLHHDVGNILMAQISGKKRVILISSSETHLLYNHFGVFSEVDCEDPNYDKYPQFREVNMTELILQPGEILFIPVGWWHHVRALEVSITVSFMNFIFPNDYYWSSLDVRR